MTPEADTKVWGLALRQTLSELLLGGQAYLTRRPDGSVLITPLPRRKILVYLGEHGVHVADTLALASGVVTSLKDAVRFGEAHATADLAEPDYASLKAVLARFGYLTDQDY